MSPSRPHGSWMTTTPGHGPGGGPAATARYPDVEPTVTSGTAGTSSGLASYLAPAGDPGAVGHRVVPEQGRRLFATLVGPGLDGVPQGADVRRPDHSGGQAFRREPAHERGLGLLLVHLDAIVVQPEVPGHPQLELLEVAQQGRG